MNRPGEDTIGPSPSKVSGERWLEKKQALLQRIARDGSPLKIDRANLTGERERLHSQVERLEEENHMMTNSVKDFELQFSKKRRMYQDLFKRSDELKDKLMGFLSREQNLLHEIELCESEKAELSDVFAEVSENLRGNISTLESTVNKIGFMKGEVHALMEKMKILEDEVPLKFRDVDTLDKKIIGLIQALRDLHARTQGAQRNVKMRYYKNKK